MNEKDSEDLLQKFIEARLDIVLVELRALSNNLQTHMEQNLKDHDEVWNRLRECEQWQAQCNGKQHGSSQVTGRMLAAGVLVFTALQTAAQVLAAYLVR